MALRLCDPRTIDIDINSASTSSSSSASAASKYGELRVRQHRKRQPKAPALFLTCLGLRLVLAVLLGGQDVEALLPVAAAGNHITVTDRDPAAAVSTLCSANTAKDSDSSAFAQLSAPVLELITPDGCASFSASDMSSLVRNIQGAVAGGVQLVQLRDYDSDAKSKAEMAARLVAATKDRALLVVNGDPEAARASGADGVHLPERMMEVLGRLVGPRDAGEWPRVVGCSVHSVAAAVKAARLGADYIQVGTMFATQSHPGKKPEGVEMLHDVRRQLQAEGLGHALVIGVGGIDASNCCKVVVAGGDGVAAIRCLCFSNDAEGEARKILRDMRGTLAASGRTEPVGDGER